MTDPKQVSAEKKTFRDYWERIPSWVKNWVEANPLWATAHFSNLLIAVWTLSFGTGGGILSVVIFMCIIFVQIYTDPIHSIPAEATQAKKIELEEVRSVQRNKWMIFAYSFMLISLLLTIYPFINSLPKPERDKYHSTLRDRPIAVFIGCSLDDKAENLRCKPKKDETHSLENSKKNNTKPDSEATGGKKEEPNATLAPPAQTDNKVKAGSTSQTGNDENNQIPSAASVGVGYAWVINIGGYIKQCNQDDNNKYGESVTCEVKDGLLVPLYFIIMALMGGSISLTRRLPELQKQAGSEHIATEKQPKLSQYEFREHLIFQMVQFISAPFLAILAYYLIEPSNATNAVALAFIAGFASETILLMVRSVANKITPETNAASQYGAIVGIIQFEVESDRKKVEVFLTELPQQAHAITDDQGLYTLSNVPVGEHSISVKSIDSEKILKKDIVKVAYAQTIFNKNITITKQAVEKK